MAERTTTTIGAVTVRGATTDAAVARTLAEQVGAALAAHPWQGGRSIATLRLSLPAGAGPETIAQALRDSLGERDA